MLKPAKLIKIRIVVTKDRYEDCLNALNDSLVLHIEPLMNEEKNQLSNFEAGNYDIVVHELQRFRSIENALVGGRGERRVHFRNLKAVLDSASRFKADRELAELIKQRDSNRAMIKIEGDKLALVLKLKQFKFDLAVLSSKPLSSFLVYTPEKERVKHFDDLDRYKVIPLDGALIVTMRKTGREEFARECRQSNLKIEAIPRMSGRPHELRKSLMRDIANLKARNAVIERKLGAFSKRFLGIVSAIREELEIENEKIEAANKFGSTSSVVVIEGWIEDKNFDKTFTLLSDVTDKKLVMEKIDTDELPPTKLSNPRSFQIFESFVRFYSIPKSNEIDPTIILGIVFPIFFGLMVGDAGYGLFMLLVFAWVINRIKHPPKHSHFPRWLSRFIHSIVSNNGLLILSKSVVVGSAIAIGFGLLFNEFFGFKLPFPTLFNVENGVGTLILVAGWIGVFMVCFGFLLGAINRLALDDKKRAAGRLGWLATSLGVTIFGLNLLSKSSPLDVNALVSYALMFIGVTVVILGEGFESVIEIPSIISHILSYIRLVGILLTSVILAQVIDIVFLSDFKSQVLLAVAGSAILILGQLFNILIALFEAGIQGARLVYVEFFSKFFTGNGKIFKPFGMARRRTVGNGKT